MKTNTEVREFETNVSEVHTSDFKILQNKHMFRILSSGLYSNKIKAVVREIGCNAWDSQVEKGVTDKPFDVQIPDSMNPFFAVRDYGVGLCEQDVYDLYCTYGGTNKNESNKHTGGFGLGSKSPFAYTDQFTVISWHGGLKTIYTVFINSEGIPSIMKVSQSKSDEPTGLEIKVPVNSDDNYTFRNEIQKVYQHFPILPEGVTEPPADWTISKDTIKIKTMSRWNRTAFIKMGNVLYELPDWEPNTRTIFTVDIGDIDITVSREAIEMTDKTIAKLKELKALHNKVLEDYISQVVKDNKWWEHLGTDLGELILDLKGLEAYFPTRGLRINLSKFIDEKGFNIDISRQAYKIHVRDIRLIWKPNNYRGLARILSHNYIRVNKNTVVLTSNEAEVDKLIEALGGIPVTKVTELNQPPKINRKKNNSVINTNYISKLENNKFVKLQGEFNPKEVIYYTETYNGVSTIKNFMNLIDSANKLDLYSRFKEIYGVQKNHVSKIKDNPLFVPIEEYIKSEFKKLIKTQEFKEKAINYYLKLSLPRWASYNFINRKGYLKSNSPYGRLRDIVLEFENNMLSDVQNNAFHILLERFNFKFNTSKVKAKKIAQLIKKCDERYPLRTMLSNGTYLGSEKFIHYIKVCDASPSIKLQEI